MVVLQALVGAARELISALWRVRLYRYPWFLLVFPFTPFLLLALALAGRRWARRYGRAYTRYEDVPVEGGGYRHVRTDNQSARLIGKILYWLGGPELMVRVAYAIYWLDHEAFFQLEWCWEGIGGWMP